MSASKETESAAEAQAERESLAAETSSGHVDPAEGAESDDETAETDSGEGTASPEPPKKKRRAADATEPEPIRDRNARVRAEAAEKRRSRREREQGGPTKRNLDASEVMDDALARSTHAAAGFLRKHFNKVQWLIMAGLVGWIGFEVYSWRHARTAEKASEVLFKALAAETGKVGADEGRVVDEDRGGPADLRRNFKNDEERLKTAQKEYVLAGDSAASRGVILSELGAAGVAYDLGQYKEAQAAYEKVKRRPAFATDSDIKGRTLEGLAMALEAQNDQQGALKTFRELGNLDSANFSALGLYHQARILKSQGKTEDTLKLLDKAGEKLATLKETPALIKYVGGSVIQLLEELDAKKAAELGKKLMSAEAAAKAAAGPEGQEMTPEMRQKIQEMMEKMQKERPPAAPAAPAPAAPAPAPSGNP